MTDHRQIKALPLYDVRPAVDLGTLPEVRQVAPVALLIEKKYQRDISAKSIKLIEHIVAKWHWTKFKPPICVETEAGLVCLDGQHTAIAAASHPDIDTIPVMIVTAGVMESRAAAFVAHNRDRIAMSAFQIFHGEVAGGDVTVMAILAAVRQAGGDVPRYAPPFGKFKVGDVSAVGALRKLFELHGISAVKRIVTIGVAGRAAPISMTVLRAILALIVEPEFAGVDDDDIATAMLARPTLRMDAQRLAVETGQGRDKAAATLLYRAACSISKGRR